jgi:hypothetical protein
VVNVSQRTTRRHGVTFVHAIVENESSERRRVRLAVDGEGATWPPRRRGVPEAGWDEDGVTLTVAAGNVRGVGFATPALVADDAVVVTASTPRGDVEDANASWGSTPTAASKSSGESTPSADGVVRALGGFAPPLAATPRESSTDAGRESSTNADRESSTNADREPSLRGGSGES